MFTQYLHLVVADTAAVVGDVFAGIAAAAALVAIVYAKRGAESARDAVREARELRIDDEYQALAQGLWRLRQAASQAARDGGASDLEELREAQTEVRSRISLTLSPWIAPGDTEAYDQLAPWLFKATDHDTKPKDVLLAASVLTRRLRKRFAARQVDRSPLHSSHAHAIRERIATVRRQWFLRRRG